MKIIDLLNKIANGEEVPKTILYENETYWYDEVEKDYYKMIAKDLYDEDVEYLLDNCFVSDILNEEIQIIEDISKEKKIPEKIEIIEDGGDTGINDEYMPYKQFRVVSKKINEIIDYLKSKGE